MSPVNEFNHLIYSFDAQPAFDRFNATSPGFATQCDRHMFVVFLEYGAWNCTEMVNGHEVLARNWSVLTVGTHDDIMRDLTTWSRNVEAGMIKRERRSFETSKYLAHWRRQLAKATPLYQFTFEAYKPAIEAFVNRTADDRRTSHPWFAEKCRRGDIQENEDTFSLSLTTRGDATDLACDLTLLANLTHSEPKKLPLADLNRRDRELFEDIHGGWTQHMRHRTQHHFAAN
jgi:hypothetical protein